MATKKPKSLTELALQAGIKPEDALSQQTQFPGLTPEVAIGNVLSLRKREGIGLENIGSTISDTRGGDESATPDAVPKTIDTPASAFAVNQDKVSAFEGLTAPEAPEFATELPSTDQARIRKAKDAKIAELRAESEERMSGIQETGARKGGASKAFLANIGALGRTISGAPVETGMGVLSDIVNKTRKAIGEEEKNLQRAISLAEVGAQEESTRALAELNNLKQVQFTNAMSLFNTQFTQSLQLAQEQRLAGADQRQIDEQVKSDTLSSLNFMLENFGAEILETLGQEDLDQIETTLGFPSGSLLQGFQILEDKKAIDPEKEIEKTQFFEDQTTGQVSLGIVYTDGTSELRGLGAGGARFKGAGGGSPGTGSGGGGFPTTPIQPDIPTFEEFIAAKEQELRQSIEPEQFREEYNAQVNELNVQPLVKLTAADLVNTTAEEDIKITQAMRLLPTKLKDSETEREDRKVEILRSLRQGKDIQEIVDEVQGFILETRVTPENKALGDTLRALAAGTSLKLPELAATINLNKPIKAMTIVENANLNEVDGVLKATEEARALIRNANRVLELLKNAPIEDLGVFDGKKFEVKKFFGQSDKNILKTQQLETAIVNLLNEVRRKSIGTQVTETELEFLRPILTNLLDQPAIIETKVKELKTGTLNAHNQGRGVVNLPLVNENQLLNNSTRLQLYRNLSGGGGGETAPADANLSDDEAFAQYQQIINQ